MGQFEEMHQGSVWCWVGRALWGSGWPTEEKHLEKHCVSYLSLHGGQQTPSKSEPQPLEGGLW